MYVTIRSYEGNSELADALAENEDSIREVLSGIDGFRAYYLVRGDGGTTSVSIYETEEAANESNRAAAAWLRENLSGMSISPPRVISGETVVSF